MALLMHIICTYMIFNGDGDDRFMTSLHKFWLWKEYIAVKSPRVAWNWLKILRKFWIISVQHQRVIKVTSCTVVLTCNSCHQWTTLPAWISYVKSWSVAFQKLGFLPYSFFLNSHSMIAISQFFELISGAFCINIIDQQNRAYSILWINMKRR